MFYCISIARCESFEGIIGGGKERIVVKNSRKRKKYLIVSK